MNDNRRRPDQELRRPQGSSECCFQSFWIDQLVGLSLPDGLPEWLRKRRPGRSRSISMFFSSRIGSVLCPDLASLRLNARFSISLDLFENAHLPEHESRSEERRV